MSDEQGAVASSADMPRELHEGFRIIPFWPFASAQFARYAEWRDVLSR